MITLRNGRYLGNNILHFEAGGMIVTATEYHNRVFEGWHSHENSHLSLIVKGGNLEERKGGETTVLPGTLLYYRPGELHRNLHTSHPSKNINLEISAAFMQTHDLDESALEKLIHRPDACSALLRIYREASIADSCSEASVQLLLLELMTTFQKLPQQPPHWLQTLVGFLQENWSRQTDLQELGRVAGVHPVTVSKHFSKYMGCTLGQYVRRIRIQQSLRMIRTGSMSLTEVAYACGFADQSHFIRHFKEATGFLPRAYRKL